MSDLASLDRSAVETPARPEAAAARSIGRAWAWVAAWFAIALVARAGLAWRLEYVPSDGAYHLAAAEAHARGDHATAWRDGLNVYPLILWGVHALGLDWLDAAKLWGTLAGSLVVWPLFGWIRREFDDATAHWACLLYALNPKLIEWSPEPLRDATFWLAMTTCVYFGRRAARDLTLGAFAATGLAYAVAVHTRVEGWFLTPPLVLWTLRALALRREARGKIVLGATLAALVFPAFLAAVDAFVPGDGPPAPSLERFKIFWSVVGVRPAPSAEALATSATPHRPLSLTLSPTDDAAAATVHKLQHGAIAFLAVKVVKGLAALYALMLLVGLILGGRRLLEFDQAALLITPLLTLAGMVLVLWYRGDTSGRYVASVAILAAPYAALGARATAAFLATAFDHAAGMWRLFASEPARVRVVATAVVAGIYGLVGITDAWQTDYSDRRQWAELGARLEAEFGSGATIVNCGPRQIAYYAHASSFDARPRALSLELANRSPRLIVVNLRELTAAQLAAFQRAREQAGYTPVERLGVVGVNDDVRVYVREDPLRTAQAPDAFGPRRR